jgi:hypothetical protein
MPGLAGVDVKWFVPQGDSAGRNVVYVFFDIY